MSRTASTPVLLFHLQYHMAILITMSPFLRTFALPMDQASDQGHVNSSTAALVLQSISSSATETIRLVRSYRKSHGFQTAHPIMIHHLLSAGLVHLMNATSSSASMQRQSSKGLHACMGFLDELRCVWPTRASKSLDVMRVLGQKWGVLRLLPVQFTQIPGTAGTWGAQDEDLNADLDPSLSSLCHPGPGLGAAELLEGFQELSSMAELEWPFEGGPSI